MLLAGVGGFLDAYTFVGYHGVFANAQTGNIVLLGVGAAPLPPGGGPVKLRVVAYCPGVRSRYRASTRQ